MVRGKQTELSLEDYERFLLQPNHVDFSIAQLNQIVSMHGFKKIHKQRKNVVFESLNEINLMKPRRRSTLQENINSVGPYDSVISLQQVKDDVEALKWQECQVHSIVTVGLNQSSNGCDDDLSKVTSFSLSFNRRRRSKRKRGKVVKWMTRDGTVDDVSINEVREFQYEDTYRWEN